MDLGIVVSLKPALQVEAMPGSMSLDEFWPSNCELSFAEMQESWPSKVEEPAGRNLDKHRGVP